MALREFLDDEGRRWRAWDVAPEEMHAATNWEDYLQGFMDGWLIFEAVDGSERCRLHPIPVGWETASDAELEALRRAARTEPTDMPRIAERGTLAGLIRSFQYPGGRVWSVAEVPVQYRDPTGHPLGEPRTVLRFASGQRTLDLLAWPDGWQRYDEDALASLLNRAFPRPARGNPTTYRRRRADAAPEAPHGA
jgi:hypothetical protein